MKSKNLLFAFIGIVVFILIMKLISTSKAVYYEPRKYLKTVEEKLDGNVTRIVEGKNFFGIVLNNNESIIYPVSYMFEKLPKGWQSFYPKDFIQVGDSIFKNAKSDTFYLIRGDKRWQYNLPK